jgi:dTDP-4-amino-4,6-dideoxygalactose transaminase
MDNIRAAIGLSQMPGLDANCARWNSCYAILHKTIAAVEGLDIPLRDDRELFVGSSLQFRPTSLSVAQIPAFVEDCGA